LGVGSFYLFNSISVGGVAVIVGKKGKFPGANFVLANPHLVDAERLKKLATG
jgi:hypothetical protein